MVGTRGNRGRPPLEEADVGPDGIGDEGPAGRLPDLLRRVLSLGFSGFFLTEEAVRKALGDTLPRDWADFAAEQSERTRAEFLERLAREMAQTLEAVDLGTLAERLLAGHTIEVEAKIRLVPREDSEADAALRVERTKRRRPR